jgi:prepilin-type N-terminal cleavage/methylation domain-containing protein
MRQSMLRRRPGRGDVGSEGFTLIELLIVMLVLGVLAATVVYAVQGITSNSVQAACGYDLKTVETAVEAYRGEMGSYPMGGGSDVAGSTDTWDEDSNAAGGLDAPLMNPSSSTVNEGANLITPAGPWLKDVPQNGTHYYIWVANNGTGKITVGKGTQTPTSAPSYADCSAALS